MFDTEAVSTTWGWALFYHLCLFLWWSRGHLLCHSPHVCLSDRWCFCCSSGSRNEHKERSCKPAFDMSRRHSSHFPVQLWRPTAFAFCRWTHRVRHKTCCSVSRFIFSTLLKKTFSHARHCVVLGMTDGRSHPSCSPDVCFAEACVMRLLMGIGATLVPASDWLLGANAGMLKPVSAWANIPPQLLWVTFDLDPNHSLWPPREVIISSQSAFLLRWCRKWWTAWLRHYGFVKLK